MKALKARVFFTCGPWWDVVSLGIRWFSRRTWRKCLAEVSHCGLEFDCDDGFAYVAESLGAEGWNVKRSRLDLRLAKGKKVLRFDVDLTAAQLEAAWNIAQGWVGYKAYDHRLIVKLAARGTFLGRMLGRTVRNDMNRLDCSEGVSYLLWLATDGKMDMREPPARAFGAVTPQMALDWCRRVWIGKMTP